MNQQLASLRMAVAQPKYSRYVLKPADGAIGAHLQAVNDVRKDFKALALTIARRADLKLELDGLQNQTLQI